MRVCLCSTLSGISILKIRNRMLDSLSRPFLFSISRICTNRYLVKKDKAYWRKKKRINITIMIFLMTNFFFVVSLFLCYAVVHNVRKYFPFVCVFLFFCFFFIFVSKFKFIKCYSLLLVFCFVCKFILWFHFTPFRSVVYALTNEKYFEFTLIKCSFRLYLKKGLYSYDVRKASFYFILYD